jgi:hypothetical protein
MLRIHAPYLSEFPIKRQLILLLLLLDSSTAHDFFLWKVCVMGEARRRGTRVERIATMREEFGVKAISNQRFNAYVSWSRAPMAKQMSQECEWFSDLEERVLGVVSLDYTDRDFGFVTLGRDEKGRFRCVDVQTSFQAVSEARRRLFVSMQEHSSTGDAMFPQGDKDNAGVDLFTPLSSEDKLHDAFKLVRSHDVWSPARAMLSEMMRHYVDVDGNFVEQFQTTGFDSRLWELYLYAYLLEDGLYVDRPDPAPDFSVRACHKTVFIEAVTVNATDGESKPGPTVGPPFLREPEEIAELLKGKMPIKFGSALFSKLNRKTPYWTLPNVENRPLVFAIADFHEPQSMTWSSSALFQYLYGVSHNFFHDQNGQLVISTLNVETHEYGKKKIPSGFFFLPNAENVSAVLFTASGTLAKFNRMGRLAGFGIENKKVLRYGLCHDHNPNASLPRPFVLEVEPGKCIETWGEGLSMFHNPKATHPVPPEMFPSIAHHWFEDGTIRSILPEFHPYTSMTMNMVITEGGEGLS